MNYQDKVKFTFCAYLKEGFGCQTFHKLFKESKSEDEFFLYLKHNFQSELSKLQEFLEKLDKYNIKYICYWEETYPEKLKQLVNPPIILFYIGNISLLKEDVMGIIGTRKPSDLGIKNALYFSKELVKHFVIASGLAFGVDIIANKVSASIESKSIVVVPGSLIKVHPYTHQGIYNDILKNKGLAISEYPFTDSIDKGSFVLRNRILAGICKSILIIESPRKGGSMLTAKIASDISTDLYSIPGNIDWYSYEGNNDLIKHEMAHFVTSPSDILRKENKPVVSDSEFIPNKNEYLILQSILKHGGLDLIYDDLKNELSFESICDIMLNLEMNGIITRNISGSYRLI